MPDSHATISPSLLERVRSRDDAAWTRLLHLFDPAVRTWVRASGVPLADVDDVVQETFLKVSRSLDSFRREKTGDTFVGWLRTLTRHRIAEFFSRRGTPAMGGSAIQDYLQNLPETADHGLDESTRGAIVRETMTVLSAEFEPHTWAAFEGTALEGLAADVVAGRLGMSVGAVYVAKSRVLTRLRRELDGLVEE